jgi:hypothetical protein
MTSTLLQKHPVKGTREFKLMDDEVHYTAQSPLKQESLSVVLSVLDPEPVVSGSTLSFVSQVNREPLVEFFLDRPDKETFEQFIAVMRRRITEEDFSRLRVSGDAVDVDTERVRESIEMLRTYVDPAEIAPFLSTLAALEASPEDAKCLSDVAEAFNDLGFAQGQVVTYAPYIAFLLSGAREFSSHADIKER